MKYTKKNKKGKKGNANIFSLLELLDTYIYMLVRLSPLRLEVRMSMTLSQIFIWYKFFMNIFSLFFCDIKIDKQFFLIFSNLIVELILHGKWLIVQKTNQGIVMQILWHVSNTDIDLVQSKPSNHNFTMEELLWVEWPC